MTRPRRNYAWDTVSVGDCIGIYVAEGSTEVKGTIISHSPVSLTLAAETGRVHFIRAEVTRIESYGVSPAYLSKAYPSSRQRAFHG